MFLRRDGYEVFEPPDERWMKVLADFRPYTIGVQTTFPRLIRESGVDLMHFTHFDHPIRCPVPFLITIHDLILLTHPSIRATTLSPLRFWMKYAAYRRVLRHAIHASIRILTPSQTVKEQIAERFGMLREKIVATPLGIDHADSRSPDAAIGTGSTSGAGSPDAPVGASSTSGVFRSTPDVFPPASTPDVFPREPYLLYVGNAYPHKNLEQLIRVMPALRERHPELRLVLVGRKDDFYRRLKSAHLTARSLRASPQASVAISTLHWLRLLRRFAPRNDETGTDAQDRTPIVFTGVLPEDELRALLTSAAVYVSPSLDEGFDLPTLEALAVGTPVVASDIPVHREVLGGAAIFFPPHNDTALIDAIHRTIIHSETHATLVDRAIARATPFTWRSCVIRTLSTYWETACLVTSRGNHERGGGDRGAKSSPPHSSSPTSTRG